MVKHSHCHGRVQILGAEGKVLPPFRVQVPMDDCTPILEGGTLEFDVGVTGSWGEGEGGGDRTTVSRFYLASYPGPTTYPQLFFCRAWVPVPCSHLVLCLVLKHIQMQGNTFKHCRDSALKSLPIIMVVIRISLTYQY